MEEKYTHFKEAYALIIVRDGTTYDIEESDFMPSWLLATPLGQFRQSLVDASRQFGKDVILELRVKDSKKPTDVSEKTE